MGKAKRRPVIAADSRPEPQKDASPPQASAVLSLGAEMEAFSDYLEMEGVPSADGLEHCGYLVVRRGEVVRVLYIGSAATGDVGWLYGEVTCSVAGAAGRRGWLPASCLEQPASPQTNSTPTAAVLSEGTGQGPGPPSGQSSATAATAAKTGPRPNTAKKAGGTSGKAHATSGGESAFPPLPGGGPTGHSGRGGEQSRSELSAPNEIQSRRVPGPPASRPDAAKTIARLRATAAQAAATAAAQRKSKAASCPICMETYNTRRARTFRPCCAVELCVVCDHKSLRSGRCYFCREGSEEFPSLDVACRVGSTA